MKSITQVVENLIKPYIDSHDRAAEAIIAPVETDATGASDDYAVGKQLILNNVLYDVIAPITTGDALVVNTNIKEANKVSSDIQTLANNLADEAKTRSIMGAKNILEINVTPSGASLTFTVNTNKSITINGTASEDNYILISTKEYPFNISFSISKSTGELTNNNYILSGNIPVDDLLLGYSVDTHVTWIFVKGGVTYNNVTIYPMIRPATDANADYEPYAMTNQELTLIASQVDTNTSAIQTINNKIANAGGAYLYWDADNSCAPITDGHYPNNGYVTLGRNSNTGTYYLMRYEQTKQGFVIDVILSSGGTVPTDGDLITLGYVTES